MRCSGGGALAVRRAIQRPAAAVRGRTGAAGACATQPRRSRRGGAGGGGAERARGHRRDFAKGLCEGTFRRDKLRLFERTFEGTFRRVSVGFPNRFPSFQIGEGTLASKGLRFRGEHYERRLARARRRRRSWDDNNRFKPRTTVTHWTQSLTNTAIFLPEVREFIIA